MTESELTSFLSSIGDARRTELNEREGDQQKKYLAELRLKHQDHSEISSGAYDNASYQRILQELRYLNQRIDDLSPYSTASPKSRDDSTIILSNNSAPGSLNQPNERSAPIVIPSNSNLIKELESRIDSLKNAQMKNAESKRVGLNNADDNLNIMKENLVEVRRQLDSLESKFIAGNKLSKTEDLREEKTYFKQQVYFDNNSETIKAEFYPNIQDLTQILIDYPEAKVLLEGWASPVGKVNHNKALSMRRAEAVEQALINNSIDKTRILISFRGEDKTSLEANARRVDMSIIVR
ncbi:OmpA family protein [Psychroflexus montanilacus]|uniref:OmpA family protein n=1 Tax=Psychroflexus montanilacus TaxID=2873598 RepID=UPI001CCE7633|nr:OmpA family protein [Psychroflexus montanilacus]MBZ9650904.1 OmpA family protein [Psychroflexus montanilacus]